MNSLLLHVLATTSSLSAGRPHDLSQRNEMIDIRSWGGMGGGVRTAQPSGLRFPFMQHWVIFPGAVNCAVRETS